MHMGDVKAVAFLNDPFRLDEITEKLKFRKMKARLFMQKQVNKSVKRQCVLSAEGN